MILSAIILTKNEQENITDCVKSLKFADEVVVIDDFSKDKTIVKAEILGVKVVKRRLNNDFSEQRNFGLEKAKGKWILFVDADERVSKKLASEIIQAANNPLSGNTSYFLKRQDFIWGKRMKYGEVGGIKLLRLGKKGEGVWRRNVHEVWDIEGPKKIFKNPLLHYPHQNLKDFVGNINHWSSLHADANKKEEKKSSLIKIVFYPPLKLLNNLFVKKGALDGSEGFVASLMMSFHSFLSWSKLWLNQQNVR